MTKIAGDMRNLRRTLATIVLAAPVGGCGLSTCPSVPVVEDTIAIDTSPDPTLAFLLDDCKTKGNCEPLCIEVFMRKYNALPPQGGFFTTCELVTDPTTGGDAVHYVEGGGTTPCHTGRRPAGYSCAKPRRRTIGTYFALLADLEAASVRAFADLHDDLRALGAPSALRRAAITAAADEVRHTRMCTQLARRHGTDPELRAVSAAARRTRRELAIDNAVEGCVRETYGAVVAGYQARSSTDLAIQRAMQRIAADEAEHADLAWRLHGWLWPQLSEDERGEVAAAAARARAELDCSEPENDPAVGLPSAEAVRVMLAELDARVWNQLASS